MLIIVCRLIISGDKLRKIMGSTSSVQSASMTTVEADAIGAICLTLLARNISGEVLNGHLGA
jgi:hypothetical protein